MIKVLNIVGARPNFMKMAPIIEAMNQQPERIKHLLVHTGQHYDQKMSKAFFDDLGMPKPDIDLGVGSGSHAEQTARVMVEFEKVCQRERPDLVVVVGDVNSTMACTITAKKLNIQVAHVEAGLRSRDMTMPEEINRLCTDVLCDYLFTTDEFANANLKAEGVAEEKIFFVGNVMIDSLLKHVERTKELDVWKKMRVGRGDYAAMTMHRPGNVDDRRVLTGIMGALGKIATEIPIIFPMHPRTRKMLQEFDLLHLVPEVREAGGPVVKGLWSTAPLGYLDFLNLNMNSRFILTDSGGLQEETTVLGIPCLTMRPNTERPITSTIGTNIMVGNDPARILAAAQNILRGQIKKGEIPPLWDGRAGERIVEIIVKELAT